MRKFQNVLAAIVEHAASVTQEADKQLEQLTCQCAQLYGSESEGVPELPAGSWFKMADSYLNEISAGGSAFSQHGKQHSAEFAEQKESLSARLVGTRQRGPLGPRRAEKIRRRPKLQLARNRPLKRCLRDLRCGVGELGVGRCCSEKYMWMSCAHRAGVACNSICRACASKLVRV